MVTTYDFSQIWHRQYQKTFLTVQKASPKIRGTVLGEFKKLRTKSTEFFQKSNNKCQPENYLPGYE